MVYQSLRRLSGWVRGTRHRKLLRTALALPDLALDGRRESALTGLVEAQLARWRQRSPLTGPVALGLLKEINSSRAGLYVFDLQGSVVDVWPKPGASRLPMDEPDDARMFRKRVNHYRTLLSEVAHRHPCPDRILLAMDMHDLPMASDEWPIFGFQRQEGASNLLLPDVDFFHQAWYLDDLDPVGYADKSISACFVGSSTGAALDAEAVRTQASERLRLASSFHGNARVVFKIAHAAHCDSEATRQLLMGQPYFSAPMGWGEQLKHRFLLSVDGNGATCSRVVKSLRSQGVLVKFRSDHELYYFPLLQKDVHFLGVESPEQVEQVLEAESLSPGHHAPIAAAGQDFAARYLSAHGVVHYTQLMLKHYGALLREVGVFR